MSNKEMQVLQSFILSLIRNGINSKEKSGGVNKKN